MIRISKFAKPRRKKGDAPVQDGLALEPQKMLDATLKGKVINSNLMANAEMEPTGSGLNVPIELRRGISINDIWQRQQDIAKKYAKYNKWKKEQPKQEVEQDNLNVV